MIPSDHFVRFYNEVFKFLDRQGSGHLERYWQTISRDQERHCLELFRKDGLQGMYDYWEHIRVEENCDMTLDLQDDSFTIKMYKCPSLSKVIDNDAGPFKGYCEHCYGWIGPLMTKTGFYIVFDLGDSREPTCCSRIFKELDAAEAMKQKLLSEGRNIRCNF